MRKNMVEAEKENCQSYLYKDLVGLDQFIDIVLEDIENLYVDHTHGRLSMLDIRGPKRDA